MLSVILVLLLIACEIYSPGYISANASARSCSSRRRWRSWPPGQTLVMLTAGIDLSVAATATAAAYIMAGQASRGTSVALLIALLVGLVVGLVNGVGVGVFRVNPLIMTLGMASIVAGYLTVSAQSFVTGVPLVPDFRPRARRRRPDRVAIPKSLLLWAPVAALILLGLRYSATAACCTRSATTRSPAGSPACGCGRSCSSRTCCARSWPRSAACSIVGVINAADLQLVTPYLLPSVAAVVIGGTSIFGGVGGYSGTILGAIILVVLDSLLTLLDTSQAVKQITLRQHHPAPGLALRDIDQAL
jgi:ribose transport system permease protein